MKRTLLIPTIGALAVLAAVAHAQPNKGDLIVTSHVNDYVGVIDRTTGALTTLSALPGDPIPTIMAANNRDVLVFERPSPWNVWSVDPSGTLAPVATASASGEGAIVGADWLQDGTVLTCSSVFGTQGWLRSLNLTSNSYTTLFTAPISHFRHASLNDDNGRYLVCLWASSGSILEVDGATQTITTITTGVANATAVDVEPTTGNIVYSHESSFAGGINVVTQAGASVRTIALPVARGVRVDDVTGNYVAPTSNSGTMASRVVEFDNQGNAVRTYGPYGTDGFAGIEIYGSRTTGGIGSAKPGSAYQVTFSFPGFGGAPYAAALSFSSRPGIPVPGGTIHLGFDNLFLATLNGLFVRNFQGSLGASGQATGFIDLPAFVPSGVRIYCAGVAISGGGFVTGNTLGITVQ